MCMPDRKGVAGSCSRLRGSRPQLGLTDELGVSPGRNRFAEMLGGHIRELPCSRRFCARSRGGVIGYLIGLNRELRDKAKAARIRMLTRLHPSSAGVNKRVDCRCRCKTGRDARTCAGRSESHLQTEAMAGCWPAAGVTSRPVNARGPESLRHLDWFDSPVGPLIVSATERALSGLSFCEPDRLPSKLQALRQAHESTLRPGRGELLDELNRQLQEYFRGERREFTLPLSSPGSPFQERVWAALCDIPYGDTWSYLQLATRVGDELATRAVGHANGANPIAIVIPCHRVIGADGSLTGYGGGIERKRWLLAHEQAHMEA